jgi:hypothetical protein
MAVSNLPIFTQTIVNGVAAFASGGTGDSLGSKTHGTLIVTGGATAGGRVTSLLLSIAGSGSNTVYIYIYDGVSVVFPLGSITIPAGSGNAGVAAVDALNPINMPGLPVDNNGKPFIHLEASYQLLISFAATSTNPLYATAILENY